MHRYDWLPDRHLGVAATLAHVDDVIAHAADLLFDYQTQPDGIVRLKEVAVVTYSETVVTGVAPIPRKVPLLVADALVSLRNSIEHTIFGEIEFLDGALDQKAARLVEMPAAETFDNFERWIKGREKNGPLSLRRGSELLRRIDALQPYQRTRDPQDHPMALLTSHTNHLKHRGPAITAVHLAAIHREDQPPSQDDVVRPPRLSFPLRAGDVIARTPRGERIPVALFPTIGINRPGTDCWPVLVNELGELATWVRTQAVPRLINGEQLPTRPLPVSYDITSGHDDERLALSSGTMQSAVQRHKERLKAAMIRQDLSEDLASMPYAPSIEQITAWFHSLDDRDVLAKMARLKMTPNYEGHIVRSNLAVMEEMCDDARRFAARTEE